jgi:hypothetical protein
MNNASMAMMIWNNQRWLMQQSAIALAKPPMQNDTDHIVWAGKTSKGMRMVSPNAILEQLILAEKTGVSVVVVDMPSNLGTRNEKSL